jgi:hypothetical protein
LPPELQFVISLRDPLAIIVSGLKHDFRPASRKFGCDPNASSTVTLSADCSLLGTPQAVAADVLRLVRKYNACAAQLRLSGSDPSLVWPMCAAAIRPACAERVPAGAAAGAGQSEAPGLVHDSKLGKRVSCSFVSDMRDWWLRFVPAAQLHTVHDSQLTGGVAARLAWRAAGLNTSLPTQAKRRRLKSKPKVSANSHSLAAMPPAVQALVGLLYQDQALHDALAVEVRRQAELMRAAAVGPSRPS